MEEADKKKRLEEAAEKKKRQEEIEKKKRQEDVEKKRRVPEDASSLASVVASSLSTSQFLHTQKLQQIE